MSEVKIPQALLNVIADINVEEINSHIYTNEKMVSWLCTWHEEVKRELYDFANNHELYQQGRADAIDEFVRALINDGKLSATRVHKIVDELKEERNGKN